ncbi:YbhB/YbcL family Raf kinase inhibitor-like protein [Patescibacteria group bacterium]|nr:YbhB/YbcL family Raf kinase inhibitor-like protein [Patescibacteria group bacterium]
MINKKKYIILFSIIIILLITTFIINNRSNKDSIILDASQKGLSKEVNLKISSLTLFSSDFQNFELIPSKFTCDGDNVNPNLEISGVNENAKSLVLIMDDPNALNGTWDHWIKFNIPVNTRNIISGEKILGVSGKGTGGTLDYVGPCPPNGKHSYTFKLYSLDTELILAEGSSKVQVEKAMKEHILQQVELVGVYERKSIVEGL